MAGLYENIRAKRKRIAAGSGEKMRKPVPKVHPPKKLSNKQPKQPKRGKSDA